MVYNSRTVNNHMCLCYVQIHCEYFSVMYSYCRLLRTIYRISVMRYFLIINCLLILKVAWKWKKVYFPTPWDFIFRKHRDIIVDSYCGIFIPNCFHVKLFKPKTCWRWRLPQWSSQPVLLFATSLMVVVWMRKILAPSVNPLLIFPVC